MSFNFPNASVISYSKNSKYLGELFNYANVKNLTVQGNILDFDNTSGVVSNFLKMSGIIASGSENGDNGNTYQEILLNNISVGSGRVTSISFDQGSEDTPRRTSYNVELEIYESGDLHNLDNSSPYYAGLKDGDGPFTGDLSYVDGLTESFSFNYGENGGYSFDHNVSLTFLADYTGDAVAGAKRIVSGIFNKEPSFGILDNEYSGYYYSLKNSGEKNFSESYDLINFSFDFTKSYNLLSPNVYQNSGAKYNLSTSHNVRISDDGKVTIQENGSIKALNGTVGNAITGALYEINNSSFGRVGAVYSGYLDTDDNKYLFSNSYPNYNSLSGLNSTPIGKTFDIDINSKTVNYSVSFTNDQFYDVSGSAKTNYSINESENSDLTISESTTYDFNFATGLSSGIAIVKNKYQQLTGSRNSTLDGLGENYIREKSVTAFPAPVTTQSSLNISADNRLSFSYETSKSYNRSYARASAIDSNFINIDFANSDQLGQSKNSVYTLSNPTNSLILQKLNTQDLSTRQLNVTVNLKRDHTVDLYSSLQKTYLKKSYLEKIELQAIKEAIKFISTHTNVNTKDVFITNVNYTFNNEYILSYTMDVSFLTQK